MQQNLVTRATFAKQAGVHASSVTRLWDTVLKPAVSGKKIDANHPVAVEYVQKQSNKKTPPPATGLDSLHEQAVEWCRENENFAARALADGLGISRPRATKIIRMMKEGGLVPEPGKPAPQTPKPKPPTYKTKREKAAESFTAKLQPKAEEIEVPEHLNEFADWPLRKLIAKFGTEAAFVDWLKAVKLIEDVEEKKLKNATTKGDLISREFVKTHLVETFNGAFIRMLTDGARTIAVRTHARVKAGEPVEEVERLIETELSKFIKPTKSKVSRILRNA